MDIGLRERLESLADDAPSRLPADADLWSRGRALRRRRTAANVAVLVMVLVAAAGLAGIGISSTRTEVPPASGHVGMPDRFFQPSGWLPGTDDDGPLGQLVAVQQAERHGWFGNERGFVGTSATTGQYRFLDLPDLAQAPDADVALSPDGRHVAYWTTGPTSGAPNEVGGVEPVAGVAVYDTITGRVRQQHIASAHGLWTETLRWMDDRTLVYGYYHWRGTRGMAAGSGVDPTSRLLTLGQRGSRPFPALPEPDGLRSTNGNGSGTTNLTSLDDHFGLIDESRPGELARHRLSEPVYDGVVLDPTGTRVAGIYPGPHPGHTAGNGHQPLLVGRLGVPTLVKLHQVPRYRFTGRVIGWADPQHVVTMASRAPNYDPGFEAVDIRTGQARTLTVLHSTSWGIQFAANLFDAPSVPGQHPPSPWDPRVKLGLAILVALGLARLWWVRRVRA